MGVLPTAGGFCFGLDGSESAGFSQRQVVLHYAVGPYFMCIGVHGSPSTEEALMEYAGGL